MFKSFMEELFGANWETSVGMIFAVIGLIPSALNNLELTELPAWLRTIGYICSFLSFIYTGIQAKSIHVTGTGNNARRPDLYEETYDRAYPDEGEGE